MRQWVTEIRAIDPKTKELKKWFGPNVPGICLADAERYCEENGLGYCEVVGELICEIPCKKGTLEPDFEHALHFDHYLN